MFVVKVLVSYGESGRYIHQDQEEYTVSCVFDPKATDESSHSIVEQGLV